MRLRMRIVSLTAVAVIAGGVAACAPAAARANPGPAAQRAVSAGVRPPAASARPTTPAASARPSPPAVSARPGTPAASARPSPSASPVIQVTGAPSGVKAKGAVLADAGSGQVLWSRDPGTERPMASVTKVMTALLVLEAGDLGREIRVPEAAFDYAWKYGGETAALRPGDVLTAQQLLAALLVPSGADAAYTLANAYGPGLGAFVARMNATAVRMGMAHTHFTSPDGLPYPTETATYSTPSDLLTLGLAAMRYPVFRSIVDLPLLPPAEGARSPPVLVGQHQRADRLLSGSRRYQDRLHRRGPALPAVRGGQEWAGADRGRPGQPRHRHGGRRAGRREDAELGLWAPLRRRSSGHRAETVSRFRPFCPAMSGALRG